MKYRIKSRQARTRTFSISSKKFKLSAKGGLRPIKAVTATEEKISFDGYDIPSTRKKKRRIKKFRPLFLLRTIALEIELFLEKAVHGAKSVVLKAKGTLLSYVERKAAEQEQKKINSLPVAFGALVGCSAVAILTTGVMFLSLFAPYAKKYETVIVPDLEGKDLSELAGTLENINLTVEYENNPDVADGQIISQSAPAGATRRVSSENGYFDLKVTVCKKETVTVPKDIEGSSLRDASLALKNSGLSYSVSEEYSASVPKGVIISVYPKSGETVEGDTQVRLTVSLGEKETSLIVPDLSGLDENQAVNRIKLSGFKVGSIIYTPSEKPLGTVISQSLRPHGYAAENSVISIWVAST